MDKRCMAGLGLVATRNIPTIDLRCYFFEKESTFRANHDVHIVFPEISLSRILNNHPHRAMIAHLAVMNPHTGIIDCHT